MFLEKVNRRIEKFDLDEPDDKEAYNDILENPLVSILTKRWEKKRKEEWIGEEGSIRDRFILIVELEEKSL
jgi:hypothetical protein